MNGGGYSICNLTDFTVIGAYTGTAISSGNFTIAGDCSTIVKVAGDYAVISYKPSSASMSILKLKAGDVALDYESGGLSGSCVVKTDSLKTHPYIACIQHSSGAGTSFFVIGDVSTGQYVRGTSGNTATLGDFTINASRQVVANNSGTYLYFQVPLNPPQTSTATVGTFAAGAVITTAPGNYNGYCVIRLA